MMIQRAPHSRPVVEDDSPCHATFYWHDVAWSVVVLLEQTWIPTHLREKEFANLQGFVAELGCRLRE